MAIFLFKIRFRLGRSQERRSQMETLLSACSESGIGISLSIAAVVLMVVGLVAWAYVKWRLKNKLPQVPDPTPPKNKKCLFEFGFKIKFFLLELTFNYKSDSAETRNREGILSVPDIPKTGLPLSVRKPASVFRFPEPVIGKPKGVPYPGFRSSRALFPNFRAGIRRIALEHDPNCDSNVWGVDGKGSITSPDWDIDAILRDIENRMVPSTGPSTRNQLVLN